MAAEAARDAIFAAATKGDAGVVAKMLDEDPQLLSVTHQGNTLLMRAISRGHLGVGRLLLERRVDINSRDFVGDAALHHVATQGLEDFAALLLTNGADPTGRGYAGTTALMHAARSGRLAVIRLFLRHMGGRGLDERNENGFTAVWYACCNGHVDALRALLLSGAGSTSACNSKGMTPKEIAQDHDLDQCVAVIQWWEGELKRGYMLHRARCLLEQQRQMQPALTASCTAVSAALAATGPLPSYVAMRLRPLPTLELVCLAEQSEVDMGKGKRQDQGDGESLSEEEKDATLKFVMHDLARELYTELLEGFHE